MKSKFKIVLAVAVSLIIVIVALVIVSKIKSGNIDLSNNKFESFEINSTESVELKKSETEIIYSTESISESAIESSTGESVDNESEEVVYGNVTVQRLNPTGGYDTIVINEKSFESYDAFISNVFNPNIIACEDGLDNLSGMVLENYTVDSASYINNAEVISVKFNTTQNFPGVFIYNKNDKTIGVFYE